MKVGVVDLLAHSARVSPVHSRVIAPATASVMPQAVAAWCQELGHDVHYAVWTGRADEDLRALVPDDVDVCIISAFTRSAFIAYALSRYLRSRGARTVLGGPHARSFAADSASHFDVVAGRTDRALVEDILRAPRRKPGQPGLQLSSSAPPSALPSIEARAKFVDHCLQKAAPLLRVVPMLASVGCPYTCNFCVDADEDWRPFDARALVDELRFIERRWGAHTLVGWHDPNFGVRFDDVVGAIEQSGTRLVHCAHMSLSLLGAAGRIARLSRAPFGLIAPGVESWFAFSDKAGAHTLTGHAKVDVVARTLDDVSRAVHHVQTNFIVGLDGDDVGESTRLTRDCVERAPGITPTFFQVTNFYNAPLARSLHERTLAVPYSLLDTSALGNVRPARGSVVDVVDALIELYAHAYSARSIAKRAAAACGRWGKAAAVLRSVVDGRALLRHHRRLRRQLEEDRELRAFVEGERRAPPASLMRAARRELGKYAELLPLDAFDGERYADAFSARVDGVTEQRPLAIGARAAAE